MRSATQHARLALLLVLLSSGAAALRRCQRIDRCAEGCSCVSKICTNATQFATSMSKCPTCRRDLACNWKAGDFCVLSGETGYCQSCHRLAAVEAASERCSRRDDWFSPRRGAGIFALAVLVALVIGMAACGVYCLTRRFMGKA